MGMLLIFVGGYALQDTRSYTVPGIGQLLRRRNTDPGWVSYLGEAAFYANFVITAPGFTLFVSY